MTKNHFFSIETTKMMKIDDLCAVTYVFSSQKTVLILEPQAVAKSAILKSAASWSVPLGSKRASSDYEVDQTALQDLWLVYASENTVLQFSGVGGEVGDFDIRSVLVGTALLKARIKRLRGRSDCSAGPVARFCVRKHSASMQWCWWRSRRF